MLTKYPNTYVNPTDDEMEGQYDFAFDLDSVINDMGEPMGRWLAKEFNFTGDPHGYHPDGHMTFHFEIPGVRFSKICLAVNRYIEHESPSLLPTPYMKEALQYVHNKTGMPILVITARHPMHQGVTYRWLKENLGDIPFRLYLMHGIRKDVPLKAHGVRVFVDDRHKTIKGLEDRQSVVLPVLYQRPWNQGRNELNNMLSVRDLRDLIPLVNISTGGVPMEWPVGLPYPNDLTEKGNEKVCYDCLEG